MPPIQDEQPLPLADILRDLAIVRASDIDLEGGFPKDEDGKAKTDAEAPEVAAAVQRSFEFVQEARAALRIQSRGELDRAGENVEHVREGLEAVLKGLTGS